MNSKHIFQNKNFFYFWLSQLISQFGDRINQMALVGLVAGKNFGSASTMELAKLLAFTIIPVFIVGPIAGVFVDRWDRKKTLFVCDFIRGSIVLLIPLVLLDTKMMWPIYVVVFLVFCLSRFYVPAKMSIIPELVEPQQLHIANSLSTITGMIAFVIGALLGGLIVEYGGAKGGFFCDALTFFLSASLIMLIGNIKLKGQDSQALKKDVKVAYQHVWHEIVDGVKYIIAHRDIRYIINLMMVLFLAVGAIYVVIIVFIQESFGSITRHLGFLAVGLGGGLFLGSLMYGKWGDKKKYVETIFSCLMIAGVVMAVFAFAVQTFKNVWIAQGLAILLGMIAGPIVIAANTVVHKVANSEMQGKVFSTMEFAIHLAFLVAMLISSKLSEFIPRSWILMTIGVVFCFVGIWGMWQYRRGLILKD